MLFAQIIFWSAALAVVYVYVGYPALLALIGCVRPRRRLSDSSTTPSLSVLIAACNEEANIEEKLKQTVQLDYPADRLEILVLSDGSQDRTDEIVRGFPDARVRLVRVAERRGKTNAQNAGVKQAAGEVLVFSDATTVYHPKALRHLAANYQNPDVGAVS